MQIKLNLKVFIFALFFFLNNQINIYSLLMFFAFCHEIGHILAGIFLGFKVQKFEITPVGFSAAFRVNIENYNKKIFRANLLTIKKMIIALAGPMINVIFILIFILLEKNKLFNIDTNLLIYVNVLIFLFNMIIIYPLDGGRIVKYILYIFWGKNISLRVTNIISNITAIIITFVTVYMSLMLENFSYFFVLIYIWIILIEENKSYKMKRKMYKILENYIAINRD